MSSTIKVGNRTFTTEEICEQLSNSDLLPQVLREIIIDEILADWEIENDGKILYSREEFALGCERLATLPSHQGLNQLQLYKIVDRHLRLKQFKYTQWHSRVYSYYLQHKSRFDRVEFSLIQVADRGLAEEIFFRVQRGEQSFADLAFKYSEDASSPDGGKISSCDIDKTHPHIAPYLTDLTKGEISSVFMVNNVHTFIRLEGYISAQLNDELTQILIDELFEASIQLQIATRLGLFEIENTVVDIPEIQSIPKITKFNPELLAITDSQATARQNIIEAEPEISDFIKPSCSFFFPKETINPDYDFEDSVESGVTSSFFFPKEISPPIPQIEKISNIKKIGYFLTFLVAFLGLEFAAFRLLYRWDSPQLNVEKLVLPSQSKIYLPATE